MLDFFNQNIKPLNDKLTEALGIKKIKVTFIGSNQSIPVKRGYYEKVKSNGASLKNA